MSHFFCLTPIVLLLHIQFSFNNLNICIRFNFTGNNLFDLVLQIITLRTEIAIQFSSDNFYNLILLLTTKHLCFLPLIKHYAGQTWVLVMITLLHFNRACLNSTHSLHLIPEINQKGSYLVSSYRISWLYKSV